MNDLVVDSELTTTITYDKNTDASTTIVEGLLHSCPKAFLLNDWQSLFNITALSHCHDTAILAHIEDTVLLEDRAEHGLYNDGRSWVRDEA